MAWQTVQCVECKTEYRVQMYGKMTAREYRVANWSGLCDDCKAAEGRKAGDANTAAGLVALTGSEKQIAWAEQIRAKLLPLYVDFVGVQAPKLDAENAKKLNAVLDMVKAETSASWWIDHRTADHPYNLLVEVGKEAGII